MPEEHEELRAAVRALAERAIAPHAADVDEYERFLYEALKALHSAGFNAVHIPDEHEGQGADAIAACIVIEEVAPVDASASLTPAVNKLGTQPIILSAGRIEEAGAAGDGPRTSDAGLHSFRIVATGAPRQVLEVGGPAGTLPVFPDPQGALPPRV